MAHTFVNLGFESPDAIPGDAFGWSQTVLSSVIEICNFGYISASPSETWEDGWDTDPFLFGFEQLDIELALFPSGETLPLQEEGFEYGWSSNQLWAGEHAQLEQALFVAALTADSFEAGWNNSTWSGTLTSVSVGLFDSGANDHESFNFDLPQNAFGYWPALSEIQGDFVDGQDGASPSTLPVGCTFVDGPRRIQLPVGFTAGGGKGFLEVGFKVGDQFGTMGSDLNNPDLYTIAAVTNDEVEITLGGGWASPGTNTTPMRLHEMWPAWFPDGADIGGLGELDGHEYFDASTFEEMDTM